MDMKSEKNPVLAIISGPSGVGKSTICRQLVEEIKAFLSVSVTTRSRGENETDGKDYWFIGAGEFQTRLEKGDLLEHAEVFGNYYGTPRQPVEQALSRGQSAILEIDVQGALAVKRVYPDALMIFILPPSQADLAGRMTARARGEDSEIEKERLNNASQEIAAAWQHYDHLVINADLQQAVAEVRLIIEQNTGVKL